MTAGSARACQGFTLMEVLIAVTLFAFIMTGLVGGLRTLAISATAIEERSRNLEDMRVVQSFLERAFDLHYPALINTAEERRWAFHGDPDRLGWVGGLPARYASHGLYWLQLYIDDGPGDDLGALVLCYAPFPDDRRPMVPEGCEQRVLLPKAASVAFAYRARDGDEWLDGWPGEAGLPVAVRMRVRGGDRWWPDQILKLNYRKIRGLRRASRQASRARSRCGPVGHSCP